jgi:HlyD family secretion protein
VNTAIMNKWVKRGLIAAVVLGVVGVGGIALRAKVSVQEIAKFRTQAIDRGPITQVVMANGTLQPVTSVNVGTQVSGTVVERLADFNDRVTKGQVLLRLDPSLIQARIRQGKAQLASAQASLTLARANYERNTRLQGQGFISGAVLEQSKRELDVAVTNVDVARAQLDSAQTDLNNSVIRSPIDGIVIKRNTDVGQTVAASFQTPDLFQIAQDLKQMQIHTNVSEADVGLIRNGQKVRFLVDAYPDREFEGEVKQFRLNPANTQGVVTYNIIIEVTNPDELLKPGMTAQTRIVVASKPDVLRIPTAALRFRPDEDAAALKKKTETKSADGSKVAASSAQTTAPATPAAEPQANTDAASDDGVLSGMRAGARVFRVYTVGPNNTPKQHDVTIGISNTRFTELASGDLKAGDAVITRSLAPANTSGPN